MEFVQCVKRAERLSVYLIVGLTIVLALVGGCGNDEVIGGEMSPPQPEKLKIELTSDAPHGVVNARGSTIITWSVNVRARCQWQDLATVRMTEELLGSKLTTEEETSGAGGPHGTRIAFPTIERSKYALECLDLRGGNTMEVSSIAFKVIPWMSVNLLYAPTADGGFNIQTVTDNVHVCFRSNDQDDAVWEGAGVAMAQNQIVKVNPVVKTEYSLMCTGHGGSKTVSLILPPYE